MGLRIPRKKKKAFKKEMARYRKGQGILRQILDDEGNLRYYQNFTMDMLDDVLIKLSKETTEQLGKQ